MDNTIFIKDKINYKFNFKKILKSNQSLIFKNCENLDVLIKNKINKINFINCKKIKIKMEDAIIGVEFYKCNNIILTVKKNIYSFESFKSKIKLKMKNKKNVYFNNEYSDVSLI